MIIGEKLRSLTSVDLFPTVARIALLHLASESAIDEGDGQRFFKHVGFVMMCMVGLRGGESVEIVVVRAMRRTEEMKARCSLSVGIYTHAAHRYPVFGPNRYSVCNSLETMNIANGLCQDGGRIMFFSFMNLS